MIDHEAAMNDDPILRERFLRELRHARHLVHERGDHAVVSRHEGEVSLDFSAAPPRIVAAIARDDLRAGLVAGIVSAARLSQSPLAIDEGLRVDPAAAGFGPDGIFHPVPLPVTVAVTPGRLFSPPWKPLPASMAGLRPEFIDEMMDAGETGHLVVVHDATSANIPLSFRRLMRDAADSMASSGRMLVHVHVGRPGDDPDFHNIGMAQLGGHDAASAVGMALGMVERRGGGVGAVQVLGSWPEAEELRARDWTRGPARPVPEDPHGPEGP